MPALKQSIVSQPLQPHLDGKDSIEDSLLLVCCFSGTCGQVIFLVCLVPFLTGESVVQVDVDACTNSGVLVLTTNGSGAPLVRIIDGKPQLAVKLRFVISCHF